MRKRRIWCALLLVALMLFGCAKETEETTTFHLDLDEISSITGMTQMLENPPEEITIPEEQSESVFNGKLC